MTSKKAVVGVVQFVWFALSAFAIIASYTGNAEPYVSPSQLPAGGTADAGSYIFGLIAVVSFGGVIVLSALTGVRWKKMGERSEFDLTRDSDGLLGSSTFSGSIRGRPIRARLVSRKSGSGGEHGSNKVTHTITEADLAEPTTMGIMIGRKGEGGDLTDFGEMSIESTVVDEFVVAGAESDQLARAILTREVREALLAVEDLDTLTIGAASERIAQELPGSSDSMVGGFFQDKMKQSIEKNIGGTPTTVGIDTKGKLGDSAEMDRRFEAVVAVADAFEAATQT